MFVNDLQLANIPNDIANIIVTQYLANDFKSLGRLSITCKNNNAKLKNFIISSFAEIYKKMFSKSNYYKNLLFYKKLNLAMIVDQIKLNPCKYKLQNTWKCKNPTPTINI